MVIVKFWRMRAPLEQRDTIRALVGTELRKVEQLFPDIEEPELATMFEVHLRRDAKLKQILKSLIQDDQVEYAHAPADRKPI